jgi:hypothetical protein
MYSHAASRENCMFAIVDKVLGAVGGVVFVKTDKSLLSGTDKSVLRIGGWKTAKDITGG